CTEDEAEETDSFVIDMHETPAEFPQFTQGIPALHKGINYLTEDERKKRERNIDAEVDGISDSRPQPGDYNIGNSLQGNYLRAKARGAARAARHARFDK
ncbi:hypothetical protein BaRGS_00035664, partial [Batillaria attramentaria]